MVFVPVRFRFIEETDREEGVGVGARGAASTPRKGVRSDTISVGGKHSKPEGASGSYEPRGDAEIR